MVLLRYLAHAVLVPALLAGCNQSLFDDGPGGGGDRRDGSPEPVDPDASEGTPDAGGPMTRLDGGAGEPDGGDKGPDAAVRDVCPPPCAGDAYGDFNTVQGGRWRYVEVQPEQPDAPYVNMTDTVLPGVVLGWIGTGALEPTIAFCVAVESGPPCLEVDDTLALTTPSNAPDTHHPALMWSAPENGTYLLTGNWRVSSAAPSVQTTMLFTRNSHANVIASETRILTAIPYEFSYEIEAAAGDAIVLSAIATTDQSVAVGVNLFVTGPYAP
jgi:hypothetical protein